MSKIILEINRNRELMGLSLINEGAPPFDLLEVLMTWIGRETKIRGGAADIVIDSLKKTDYINSEEKLLKTIFDELSAKFGMTTDDLIKRIKTGELSDARFDEVISKLMLVDDELFNRLFQIYIYTTPIIKQIDDSIKYVKSLMQSGQKKVTKYDLFLLQKKIDDMLFDSLHNSEGPTKVYRVIEKRANDGIKSLISDSFEYSNPRQEAIDAVRKLAKTDDQKLKNYTYGMLRDELDMLSKDNDFFAAREDLIRLKKEFNVEYKEEIVNDKLLFGQGLSNQVTPK
jgi:hypothetical protein